MKTALALCQSGNCSQVPWSQSFPRFLRCWYLQGGGGGALVFGGLTVCLGIVRFSDRQDRFGMWMGSGLSLMHAGFLLLLRCLLFLLKIFPSSVLTSYYLTSTCCSTQALNHLPGYLEALHAQFLLCLGGGSSLALMLKCLACSCFLFKSFP